MIDTAYNRRKMVWYILGMRRAISLINSDDDPATYVEDTKDEIECIKKDWGISEEQLKSAIEKAKKP